jgi:ABC-type methionine transport system ATPase subunit
MTSARWHLTYSEDTVSEPIVWALGADFGLVTNIKRADVRDHLGWVIVDVEGPDEQIAAAKAWLKERGLRLSELTDGDVSRAP